ncbi:hypothetical protein, partial [Streptomyces phaeochromogenes]|uniref:hypothetical protein n=1 Tax=Streptomyces phaeochromogenes TaxID=1923 RepID=UPI002E2E0521
FLAEFLALKFRLAANSFVVYSGRWRVPWFMREFAWRQILGCGWCLFLYFAWRQNSCSLVFWAAGAAFSWVLVLWFVGALVRSGC